MDVLRGVICLYVMGLHFADLFQDAGGWLNWLVQFRPGVESVFVLSGYFLAATYNAPDKVLHDSLQLRSTHPANHVV